MEPKAALGIIGGSGLYRLSGLTNVETLEIETPFGTPSSPIRIGEVQGVPVAFLSRHGEGHVLMPSEVPYAANVYAMKMLGVERLVSISAVGSLREEVAPRSFVVPDNIIDRTIDRQRTFFGDGLVAHVSMADPFCVSLATGVAQAAAAGGLGVSTGGTYVCIEGPQFSTRAESNVYRSWGASVIGMTAMPEARLAREAGLCYACLAMVTDYDVWHTSEEPVSVEAVVGNLMAMTGAIDRIVPALAGSSFDCACGCADSLASAIITDPSKIDVATRQRLALLIDRFLPDLDTSA